MWSIYRWTTQAVKTLYIGWYSINYIGRPDYRDNVEYKNYKCHMDYNYKLRL